MNLGKKIKKYRNEKNLTQEQLAEYLGVSFQAVSKWENNLTYPDITLLPSLANIFEISLDDLFDMEHSKKLQKIKTICDKAYHCRYAGNYDLEEQVLRDGLKEFPNNYLLLNHLLYPLSKKSNKESIDEMLQKCTLIINECTDYEITYDAIRFLAITYKKLGDMQNVKNTLEKLPEIYFSKLSLQAELFEGEEQYKICQSNIALYLEHLIDFIMHMAKYCDSINDFEKSLYYCKVCENLIKLFFENKDYMYFNIILMNNSIFIAKLYIKLKDEAKAISYIKEAKEYAKSYDTMKLTDKYSSRCFDALTLPICKNYDKKALKTFYNHLSDPLFDNIRETIEIRKLPKCY